MTISPVSVSTASAQFPCGTREEFLAAVRDAVRRFPDNRLCRKVDHGQLSVDDYRRLLRMLFFQAFEGPATFALAASHADPMHYEARDYLIQHAEEERQHWQWIVNDLAAIGDSDDPRCSFPPVACQAYVAFITYIALRAPLARLAVATTLESIGAAHGKRYAMAICSNLKLDPRQVTFFFGHGDTDVGHSAELVRLIDRCTLSPRDWAWMAHAANTAGALYSRMYDEA